MFEELSALKPNLESKSDHFLSKGLQNIPKILNIFSNISLMSWAERLYPSKIVCIFLSNICLLPPFLNLIIIYITMLIEL